MTPGTVTVGFLHPGHWSACFGQSLTDLLFFDAAHNKRIVSHAFGQLGKECHAARIHAGRNEIAANVLDHSASEWLVFIDSDMGFSPTVVEELIAAADPVERPIIGGLCFGHKSDGRGDHHANRYRIVPTIFTMAETDDEVGFIPMLDYPRNELVKADATGAALLLIHRSVLQEIRDAYGDRWFSPMEVPKGKSGRTEFSEDISFCIRAMAVGRALHVHTGIRTTHDKGGVFLDEATYDAQRTAKARADAQWSELILATGGLLSPIECAELAHFASRATGPALEVGNYTGLSTIVISRALPTGTPFVTVDPHVWRITGDTFADNVNRWGGPVQSVAATFQDFLAGYAGPPFSFVFYDGPHTPEDCEAFWAGVKPHLADDVVICWDDADWPTMTRLAELASVGRAPLAREPMRRHAIAYSTGDAQVDLDLGKRHPDTYTLAVWGPS